jgi:hypothetical protein
MATTGRPSDKQTVVRASPAPSPTVQSTGNSETPPERAVYREVESERRRLLARAEVLRRLAGMESPGTPDMNERALLGEALVALARNEVIFEIVSDEIRALTEAQIRDNKARMGQLRTEQMRLERSIDLDAEKHRAGAQFLSALRPLLLKVVRDARVASTVASVLSALATALLMGQGCPGTP